MEQYMHLIVNNSKHKKNNNCDIDNDLYYLLKKRYKNYIFDKFIFNTILNEINIILNNHTIDIISQEFTENLLSEIIQEYMD